MEPYIAKQPMTSSKNARSARFTSVVTALRREKTFLLTFTVVLFLFCSSPARACFQVEPPHVVINDTTIKGEFIQNHKPFQNAKVELIDLQG
jgi:hypothetical protein